MSTIFADPSENRFFAEFPTLPVSLVAGIEELTGADFIISPLDLPWVPVFHQRHIDAGAVFVQRKSGMDLPSSVPDRINSSLARMRTLPNIKQSQCVLLFIGVMLVDADGKCTIDYRKVDQYGENSYWMIQGAVSKWAGRGGCYENIPKKALFPEWANMKARHANEFYIEPVKYVYAEKPTLTAQPMQGDKVSKSPIDPFQELIRVNDWRNTLLTMPGMGPSKVQALFEVLQKNISYFHDGTRVDDTSVCTPTLIDALSLLSSYKLNKSIKTIGIGPGMVENIRRWLGIPDGWDLDLVPSEEK
jgi:hypothetical protein